MKYSRILSTCPFIRLFYNVLQNYLRARMNHYLIYYLRTFLKIFIFGYPASNIAINSSTSSCISNVCVTPLSSKLPTTYRICIIILAPSVGTTKSNIIGHADVFCLGMIVTRHTININ